MMPKKDPSIKRSYLIGVKVTKDVKLKIDYLAGQNDEKAGTYIYNILVKHLLEKEPWISKEIADLKNSEEVD